MAGSFFSVTEFGKTNTKVLFFFAGMGTRTWLYRRPINRLVKNGYRVFAYDFDAMIVRNGDADSFLEVARQATQSVNQQVEQLKRAGVKDFYAFGVSMGTLLAIKCAAEIPEITKVVINLTYGSVAENVWTWWAIKPAKLRAIKQGYTMEQLDKKLAPISPIPHAEKLKGKKVLLYLSLRDKVLLYEQSRQFKEALDKAGVQYTYIENKRFGHIASGFVNFINHKTYLQFLNN